MWVGSLVVASHRCAPGPVLLCRAQLQLWFDPGAQELPYVAGAAVKRKKKISLGRSPSELSVSPEWRDRTPWDPLWNSVHRTRREGGTPARTSWVAPVPGKAGSSRSSSCPLTLPPSLGTCRPPSTTLSLHSPLVFSHRASFRPRLISSGKLPAVPLRCSQASWMSPTEHSGPLSNKRLNRADPLFPSRHVWLTTRTLWLPFHSSVTSTTTQAPRLFASWLWSNTCPHAAAPQSQRCSRNVHYRSELQPCEPSLQPFTNRHV